MNNEPVARYVHMAVCSQLTDSESEIEQLKAKVAELTLQNDKYKHSLAGTQLASIEADAIDKAIREVVDEINWGWDGDCGVERELTKYSEKLRAGKL